MSKLKNTIIFAIIILLIYTLLVSGCIKNNADKDESKEVITVEDGIDDCKDGEEEIVINGIQCPLSGEIIENELIEGKRIAAVIIDNHPKSMPQAGLKEARLVYEIPVEGGITRYLAFYTNSNQDLKIGPVRSARHYHFDLVMEYDAVLAYFGGSPLAWQQAQKLNIAGMNGIHDGVTFFINNKRKAPYDKYTSIDRIYKSIERKSYSRQSNTRSFNFDEELLNQKNNEANLIKIAYPPANYSIRYIFDKNESNYIRYINNKAHTSQNGELIRAKNLIIQKVNTRIIKGDKEGRLEIDLVSEGEGYLITNGNAIEIKWKKEDRRGKTIFSKVDGTEISLNQGNTWIQILPNNGKVEIMK